MLAAVFTQPQIASVGLTEQDCRGRGLDHLVGMAGYGTVAYGWAMEDTTGFCKVLAESGTGRLLGAHLMGAEARGRVNATEAVGAWARASTSTSSARAGPPPTSAWTFWRRPWGSFPADRPGAPGIGFESPPSGHVGVRHSASGAKVNRERVAVMSKSLSS
ncbi:hypothetical protein ACFV9E_41640 [Streptomyces sp. NPDC059835]|uniref:hypothetical protein n=1 Tax=Streptomyces sp. NPDC059835 TaxID=3346967 RepID=UPI003663C35E